MKTATKRDSKAMRTARLFDSLSKLGFTYAEADALRRIEMTLHRWDEAECGDGNDFASWSIERDETTGKPFRCVYPHNGPSRRTPIADREAGAMRRLKAILDARNVRELDANKSSFNSLIGYHQGDCRGCALYLVRAGDVPAGESIDSYYNRGLAVCI
jgi:hypothetical protein